MNQTTMHSTSPTRVGILPVLDYGPPAGAAAAGGNVAAPFDTLLYPPPPVCPPPQENSVAERRGDLRPSPKSSDGTSAAEQPPSRDKRVEPASDEPLAEEQPEAAAEEVTEVSTDAGGDKTTSTDDPDAAEALQAVQSLVALTGIAPPVVQGDSPTESDGEETAATAIEPAGNGNAPDTKQPALQAPALAFDSEQQLTPSEPPSEAAVDGITDVAAEPLHVDAQIEPVETDDSNKVKNSADSDAKLVELKVDKQQEFSAVGEDSGSASKHHAESVAALNTDRSTNETTAARSSQTAGPAVAAPEHSAAPLESSRSIHSPGLSNPDPTSGSVPRSRLRAAVSVLEPSTNQPSVQIDSVRLLQRVARAFHAAQQQRDGEIQLRLSPAELGSLRLQVQVVEGALTARVEAENPAARAALIDNLPLLRERLQEQGVRIERFEVDLMQRHSGGGMPDRPRDHDRSLPQLPPAATNVRTAQQQAARVPIPRTAGPGKLNVVV